MLVAIQKDPTIDAVFSIGSCCGPGMGGRSRTARRPRLSVVCFSARSTYWSQYAHQGVQRQSEPRSCSGVSCISGWHRHAKLALRSQYDARFPCRLARVEPMGGVRRSACAEMRLFVTRLSARRSESFETGQYSSI